MTDRFTSLDIKVQKQVQVQAKQQNQNHKKKNSLGPQIIMVIICYTEYHIMMVGKNIKLIITKRILSSKAVVFLQLPHSTAQLKHKNI